MRVRSRRLAIGVCAGAIGALAIAGVAFGGTITQPVGSPFTVPGDAAGNALPFTIIATGYAPNALVSVEQCDGTPASAAGWSPTTNCDSGTSPAQAIADASGTVTFNKDDPNFSFHPFKGESPQSLFNCLGPNDPQLNNALTNFTNCQVRVATSLTGTTPDQALFELTLPNTVAGVTTTTTTSIEPTTTSTAPTGTTVPGVTTTTVPGETTTTAPGETTTTVPGETTTVPAETTTVPEDTTTVPDETTTLPEETTTTEEPTTSTTIPNTVTTGGTGATTSTTTAHEGELSTTTTTSPFGALGTTVDPFSTVAAADAGSTANVAAGTLPRTGSSSSSLAVTAAALALIGAGIGLAAGPKRRRA